MVRTICARADVTHVFDQKYINGLGLPQHSAVVIPNSVTVPANLPAKEDVVVFAGEVGYRKGVDTLMDAWRILANKYGWKLMILGSQTEDGRRVLAGHHDVKNWTAPGIVEVAQVREVMEKARILVQPSRAEAFPMAVCEAMAQGCAVIGTTVGALGGLLRSAGQVAIASGDSEILASSMEWLMSDRESCNQLASLARTYAEQRLSRSVVRQQWVEVYRSLTISASPR
jgi:glycosyltransferase involved in cell wall biosynthesis